MSTQGGDIDRSNSVPWLGWWMIGTAVAYLLLIANLAWLKLDTYLRPNVGQSYNSMTKLEGPQRRTARLCPDGGIPETLPSYVWKSAYGVIAAMLLTIPFGVGFFLYGGVFALLSDATAFLVGLVLAPIVWGLYLLNRDDPLNRTVFVIGVIAVAGICIGGLGLTILNLQQVDAGTSGETLLGIQFVGWLLLGGWLLGTGILSRRTGSLSERTSWTAIVAGIGSAGVIVSLVYSYAVGDFTVLFPLFAVVFVLGFLVWAFWLGGELRAKARDETVNTDGRPR